MSAIIILLRLWQDIYYACTFTHNILPICEQHKSNKKSSHALFAKYSFRSQLWPIYCYLSIYCIYQIINTHVLRKVKVV